MQEGYGRGCCMVSFQSMELCPTQALCWQLLRPCQGPQHQCEAELRFSEVLPHAIYQVWTVPSHLQAPNYLWSEHLMQCHMLTSSFL
jgi:hypothetical protein